MTTLGRAVAKAVKDLAPPHVRTLAAAYGKRDHYSSHGASAVAQSLPGPRQGPAIAINTAWSTEPDLPGSAVALALEAALESRELVRPTEIEVVVTGPASPAAPVRLTSQVVRQLVDQAIARVMLVSFSAYSVTSVIEALDRAVERGVKVQLVLESAENLDGGGGAEAYAKYDVFEWPSDLRQPPTAKLHAKAVLVDGEAALLTSANLTNHAFDKNLELGVLLRGGKTATKIQQHFDALISEGTLRKCEG